MRAAPTEYAELRLRLASAEAALEEARALTADLSEQLTRANAAAVRMARRASRSGIEIAA